MFLCIARTVDTGERTTALRRQSLPVRSVSGSTGSILSEMMTFGMFMRKTGMISHRLRDFIRSAVVSVLGAWSGRDRMAAVLPGKCCLLTIRGNKYISACIRMGNAKNIMCNLYTIGQKIEEYIDLAGGVY